MTSFFPSPEEALTALQAKVTDILAGRRGLRALEAGAGKRTRLKLAEDAYVVGVDNDAEALARNVQLDERVLSDLAAYAPGDASFDVVTSWYVLEHVHAPRALLASFARWVAPGGLIVLAVPNLRSPKALVIKLTRTGSTCGSGGASWGSPTPANRVTGRIRPRCAGRSHRRRCAGGRPTAGWTSFSRRTSRRASKFGCGVGCG
jgi:SAM-dependent methyltransferase